MIAAPMAGTDRIPRCRFFGGSSFEQEIVTVDGHFPPT
jgi:hypothetical protein